MKFKYYLRGAGISMVVTAIIMSIAFSKISSEPKADEVQAQVDHGETVQMVADAEEMEEPKDNEASNNEEINENESSDSENIAGDTESNNIEDKSDNNFENKKDNNVDNKEASNADGAIDDSNDADDNDEDEVDAYKVTIISGEVSNRIADRLEGLGLVDDGKAFNKYLEEKKVDHSLRPGTYMIKKGLSYEEIVDILIKK